METIKARDIDKAFKILVKKALFGLLKVKEDVGFYQRKKVLITYEEVTNGTTKTRANEIEPGTSMGAESIDIST
tara:strand:- start:516 stop:737 length:222 start_codon:yes stop_codon:yes gene_type:complete